MGITFYISSASIQPIGIVGQLHVKPCLGLMQGMPLTIASTCRRLAIVPPP